MTYDKDWVEVTVKRPNRFTATPEEILDFLRENFPEDRLLKFQQKIVEGGLREAVSDVQRAVDRKAARNPDPVSQAMKEIVGGIMGMVSPDSPDYEGFWPSVLLCGHHDGIGPCKGAPWCWSAKWRDDSAPVTPRKKGSGSLDYACRGCGGTCCTGVGSDPCTCPPPSGTDEDDN